MYMLRGSFQRLNTESSTVICAVQTHCKSVTDAGLLQID